MKKNKKMVMFVVIFILISFYVTMISDYRLANGEKISNVDKLCGILITHGSRDEYMEAKSEEYKLSNNNYKIDKKGNLVLKEDNLKSLLNNKYEGKLVDKKTIKFKGVKGYFMGIIPLDNNGEIVKGVLADEEIRNVNLTVNVTDRGEENSCEGTISVLVQKEEVFNANPVYQRADESFYVLLGEHPGVGVAGHPVPASYSMFIDNTNTSTHDYPTHDYPNHDYPTHDYINHEYTTLTNKINFKINIKVVDQVQHVYIKEMNDKDELIKTTEFKSSDDREFVVSLDTAYIIVDEVFVDQDNANYRQRSTYSFSSNEEDTKLSHLCNFPGEDNMISGVEIQFIRK